jgi:hypothetical protein
MPSSTSGIGGQTQADQVLEKQKQELADVLKAETALRKEKLTAAKARQVNMSVADYSALSEADKQAAPKLFQAQSIEAARIAKNFESEQALLKEQEAEKKKALAESADKLRTFAGVVGVAALGISTINSALKEMQSLRSSGAEEIGSSRISLASSLAGLGYSPKQQDEMIKKGETQGALGKFITPQQRAQLFAAAEKTRAGTMVPASDSLRNQIESIINDVGSGKVPFQDALSALGQPFLPQTALGIRRQGAKAIGRKGLEALANEATLASERAQSQAENIEIGRIEQASDISIESQARDDMLGGLTRIFDNPLGRLFGRSLVDIDNSVQDTQSFKSFRQINDSVNPVTVILNAISNKLDPLPPSTNPTR